MLVEDWQPDPLRKSNVLNGHYCYILTSAHFFSSYMCLSSRANREATVFNHSDRSTGYVKRVETTGIVGLRTAEHHASMYILKVTCCDFSLVLTLSRERCSTKGRTPQTLAQSSLASLRVMCGGSRKQRRS